jgi:hypothetical protein
MQLLQHLSEDDPDRWMEFCEWVVNKLDDDTNFPFGILFTDEDNFTLMESLIAKTYVTGVITAHTG